MTVSASPDSEWQLLLFDHIEFGAHRAELLALADRTAQPWRLRAELAYHEAAQRLAEGDRDVALADLDEAYRSFDGETRYTYHARTLLVLMRDHHDWPRWMGSKPERTK